MKTTEHLIASEWLVCREIIGDFLHELLPGMSKGHIEHNAAALSARLAQHEPPISMEFQHKERKL